MSIRGRVERLEARVPRPTPPRPRSTLDEIRDLERHPAGLEAEILAAGETVEPLDLPDDLDEVAAMEAEMLASGSAGHEGGEGEEV